MSLVEGQQAERARTFAQRDFERFAQLSGDDNPIHVDPNFAARTRFERPVAHGMLLYSVLSGVLHDELLPPGSLQLEQELVFPAPTFADEAVKFSLQVTSIHEGQDIAEISMQIVRPDGEMSCQGRTLARLPGSGLVFLDPPDAAIHPIESAKEMRGLRLGQKASQARRFSVQDIDEYLSISQDTNALIADRDFARRSGFEDRLIPNGLLGGLISDLLGTELPGRGTNWLKQRFRFLAPAYPREQIMAQVEIVRLRPEKDLVNLRTRCLTSDGKLVCDGAALVLVKDLIGYSTDVE